MGVKERREREREALRTKILDAARDLFAREGYEAVTMRRIADAIEYSPTAIYLHFADKEALIRELCETDFLALAKAFQRIAKEPDPFERLRKIGHAYVDFALDHPNHYRLMFMTPPPVRSVEAREIERGNPQQDAYAFLKATVTEAVAAGRLRPELEDVELLSQALWAGVHGVVSLHVTKGADDWVDWRPAKKTATLVIDATLRGLAAGGR